MVDTRWETKLRDGESLIDEKIPISQNTEWYIISLKGIWNFKNVGCIDMEHGVRGIILGWAIV